MVGFLSQYSSIVSLISLIGLSSVMAIPTGGSDRASSLILPKAFIPKLNKVNIESNYDLMEFTSSTFLSTKSLHDRSKLLTIRGGGQTDDEEEEDYDDDDETNNESSNSIIIQALTILLSIIGNIILTIHRVISTGLSELKSEEALSVSKLINVFNSMVQAIFMDPNDDNDAINSNDDDKNLEEQSGINTKSSSITSDFGDYLIKTYNIELPPLPAEHDEENEVNGEKDMKQSSISIQGGSFTKAMEYARSQGRLLVIFIPHSTHPKSGGSQHDQTAITSILSPEVSYIAERKARKKGPSSGGSFCVWSTRADSPEAIMAIKRLKLKNSGGGSKKKCPTLVAVYPKRTAGRSKLTPQVLAQHHCNPPPSPESMATWLNVLRKRHKKEYGSMQYERNELAMLKERTEGYKSSVQDDTKRAEEERKEEEKRLEEERIAKEREEMILERRKDLLESLEDEPENSSDVITIALRFSDGRTGRRRFVQDTSMDDVFNWVDAVFEVERESIILSSMSGKKSFEYNGEEGEGLSLKEAGLGKMAGLLVTRKKDSKSEVEESS